MAQASRRACAKELWQESTVILGIKPTLVWLEARVGRAMQGGWAWIVGRIPYTVWSVVDLAQFLIYIKGSEQHPSCRNQ